MKGIIICLMALLSLAAARSRKQALYDVLAGKGAEDDLGHHFHYHHHHHHHGGGTVYGECRDLKEGAVCAGAFIVTANVEVDELTCKHCPLGVKFDITAGNETFSKVFHEDDEIDENRNGKNFKFDIKVKKCGCRCCCCYEGCIKMLEPVAVNVGCYRVHCGDKIPNCDDHDSVSTETDVDWY